MKYGKSFFWHRSEKSVIVASWHWNWSLTWRWILSYSFRKNKWHRGLYWHPTHQGQGVICGLNAAGLGSLSLHVQPNMNLSRVRS